MTQGEILAAAKAPYGEIKNKEQWDALPNGTQIDYSFGWASRSMKAHKRGNRIIGQVSYLDSDSGEWVSSSINRDISSDVRMGTLHFYMAIK